VWVLSSYYWINNVCFLDQHKESTPLHISAHYGPLEATKALVERGAAINNTDENGDSALMVAVVFGKSEIFRYLTEIGADINIHDDEDKQQHCSSLRC